MQVKKFIQHLKQLQKDLEKRKKKPTHLIKILRIQTISIVRLM